MNEDENQARRRYILLNAMRFGGLAIVLLGIAISLGKFDLPPEAGLVVSIAGMLEFFFLPYYLARRWNSEDR